MTKKEKAIQIFWDKFNCSQAVLGAFAEELGLPEKQAMKVALCFSAGMRDGQVCGAVSGAIMAIGLKYGELEDAEAESKALAYQKTTEFLRKFQEKNGSYICKEILACDISTEEGRQYAKEHNCFHEICPKMVETAVELLESEIY